jgi:hypothetical protein
MERARVVDVCPSVLRWCGFGPEGDGICPEYRDKAIMPLTTDEDATEKVRESERIGDAVDDVGDMKSQVGHGRLVGWWVGGMCMGRSKE